MYVEQASAGEDQRSQWMLEYSCSDVAREHEAVHKHKAQQPVRGQVCVVNVTL